MFVPGLSPPSGRSATSCVTKTDPPPDTPRIRGVALRSGTGGHLKREPGAESAKGPRLPTAEGASVSPQGGPEPSQLARFKTHGTGCACGGIFTAASQAFPVRLPAAASFGGSMARPADPAGFQPVCRTISTSDDIASAVGSSAPKDRPFPCRAWQFRHGRASGPKPSGAAFRRMAGRRTQGVGCGHSAPLAAASRAHAPFGSRGHACRRSPSSVCKAPRVAGSRPDACAGSRRAGRIRAASDLPSSTPHWSNGLTPQMQACTKTRCS